MAPSRLWQQIASTPRVLLRNVSASWSVSFAISTTDASTVGAAQGVNQAAQCVGAILIAPLVRRWPTRTVLSTAVIVFCMMTTILLIVDAATGEYSLYLQTYLAHSCSRWKDQTCWSQGACVRQLAPKSCMFLFLPVQITSGVL